jgi:hypothetical protein
VDASYEIKRRIKVMDEYRKHINDMTFEDVGIIEILTNENTFRFSNYMLKTMNYREISKEDVLDTIKNGNVIELHIKNNDIRVLKRSIKSYIGYDICVVYGLISKDIITCYKNTAGDNHSTLDLSLYQSDINVKKTLELYGIISNKN